MPETEIQKDRKKKSWKFYAGFVLILLGFLMLLQAHFFTTDRWVEVKRSRCDHVEWVNGQCAKCGLECAHEKWEDGACVVCGTKCAHDWEKSVCTICGSICSHPTFSETRCEVCGFECRHPSYIDGICSVCGHECEHEWRSGVCSICSMKCEHEHHDMETMICKQCGEIVPHHYVNGGCECGATPLFYFGWLPWEYYEACSQPGEVQTLYYEQECYDYEDIDKVWKRIDIYLPYGYNESQKYNVLVMVHGGGDDETSWTTKNYGSYFGWNVLIAKNIYDNMIMNHLCEPFIVVSPTTYNGTDSTYDSSIEGFSRELHETILPYVAEHYNTYAASGSLEDLQAARMHFGIGGNSNGALFALDSGMQLGFDVFANFACFSGNNQPDLVAEAINSEEWKDLPVGYFFAGAGVGDGQRQRAAYGFYNIIGSTDRFEENRNCRYIEVEGGHEWTTWATEIFNALQVLFPVRD